MIVDPAATGRRTLALSVLFMSKLVPATPGLSSLAPAPRARAASAPKAELSITVQTLISVVAAMAITAVIMYIFVGGYGDDTVSLKRVWRMGMSISVLASAIICPLLAWRTSLLVNQLQQAHDLLDETARRDSMTGLLNRRGVESAAAEIWAGPARPVAVLMCDIDKFKAINDTYGHDVGDLALIHVADVVRQTLEAPGRAIGRQGGEEFAALLPGLDLEAARRLAEEVRAACEARPLRHGALDVPITLSIGVAAQDTDEATLYGLLSRADKGLYQAKQGGRNRVVPVGALPGAAEAAIDLARLALAAESYAQ